jgi:dipeptidyl aminopeptidase/acylaminoacyl peptidase
MADSRRLRDLGVQLEHSIPMAAFDDLQRRGKSRAARRRAGAVAAVVTLVAIAVVGVAISVDRESRSDQPVDRPDNILAAISGRIVFQSGSGLLAADPEPDPDHASDPVSVLSSPRFFPVAWSHDASRLLLSSGATEDLYVLNADGSRTRLTHDGASDSGSFSPDGEMVVYGRLSSHNGQFSDDSGLYLIDSAGGTPTFLMPAGGRTALASTAWSPDGSRIAFIEATVVGETSRGEPIYRRTLSVVNADGSRQRALLDLGREDRSSTGWAGGLVWSPDGERFAFFTASANGGIYVVNADGSELRRLTDIGANPAWSPDGARIAFGCGSRLCTMTADGTEVRRVDRAYPTPTGGFGFVWAS